MLVLTRKKNQTILIGDDIKVSVKQISGGRVTLAIEAPDELRILRQELPPDERRRTKG